MSVEELKAMNTAGVRFSVPGLYCGSYDINAEDIPAFMADRLGWYATAYGISRERMAAFDQLVRSNYRCLAHTRRGTRCRLQVEGAEHLGPVDYDQERDGYCRLHWRRPPAGAAGWPRVAV